MITQSKDDSANSATTTRDICLVLFRHKSKVILCFTISICAAIAVIFFWPRKYKSESKLLVRVGRETVALDPTATTGQIMPISVSRESEVATVLEMLRSRVIVEKLVDEIGVKEILHPGTAATNSPESTPPDAQANPGLKVWLNLDPVGDLEKAIARVAACLDSTIQPQSDVITVSAT